MGTFFAIFISISFVILIIARLKKLDARKLSHNLQKSRELLRSELSPSSSHKGEELVTATSDLIYKQHQERTYLEKFKRFMKEQLNNDENFSRLPYGLAEQKKALYLEALDCLDPKILDEIDQEKFEDFRGDLLLDEGWNPPSQPTYENSYGYERDFNGDIIFEGPRGGRYRYNSKGHKSYDV